MDSFINAVNRAHDPSLPVRTNASSNASRFNLVDQPISLSSPLLTSRRIVSHDASDPITRSFDVMRNACINDVPATVADKAVFAVTAPTAGCGASTTAANLAFSLARQHKGEVILADFSAPGEGLRAELGEEVRKAAAIPDAIVSVQAGDTVVRLAGLLPVLGNLPGPEAKTQLREWVAALRRQLGPVSIVLDLPPLLASDHIAAVLSEIDLVLLVVARGRSTVSELETCTSYLHGSRKVQLVLNRARSYDL